MICITEFEVGQRGWGGILISYTYTCLQMCLLLEGCWVFLCGCCCFTMSLHQQVNLQGKPATLGDVSVFVFAVWGNVVNKGGKNVGPTGLWPCCWLMLAHILRRGCIFQEQKPYWFYVHGRPLDPRLSPTS